MQGKTSWDDTSNKQGDEMMDKSLKSPMWNTALDYAMVNARITNKSSRKYRRFYFAIDKLQFLDNFSEEHCTNINVHEFDWIKIQNLWSQDKDFLRESWDTALEEENKFNLFLLHAVKALKVCITYGVHFVLFFFACPNLA